MNRAQAKHQAELVRELAKHEKWISDYDRGVRSVVGGALGRLRKYGAPADVRAAQLVFVRRLTFERIKAIRRALRRIDVENERTADILHAPGEALAPVVWDCDESFEDMREAINDFRDEVTARGEWQIRTDVHRSIPSHVDAYAEMFVHQVGNWRP